MPEPQRLPLTVRPENRDETTNKDARIVNGYVDQVSKEDAWVYKRPGVSVYASTSAPTTGVGLGIFNWQGDIYSIFGQYFYKNGLTVYGEIDTTTTYTFSSCLGATPKLFFHNGVVAYTYDDIHGVIPVDQSNITAFSGTTVAGTTTVTGISPSTASMTVGLTVTGTNIPANTTISTIDSTTQITLSAAATGTGPTSMTLNVAGTATTGTATITGITPSTSMLAVGMHMVGVNLGTGAYIISIDSSSQVTLSVKSTASGATVIAYDNYGIPASLVKGSAYLDGTTYVMTQKAAIHGDAFNDPTQWDPLNYLLAQIEPDHGIRVAKQLAYVIAFKQWSTEVFYDAGNATGSPLGPVQGGKVNYGCRHQDTVQDLEGVLFWVGATRTGSVSVFAMEGLKATPVSTPAIERLLQQADFSGRVYSWTAKVDGHRWYGVTLVNSNLTLVYDITSKYWYQWTDSGGNYLPYVGATFTDGQQMLFQHESDGSIYQMESTSFTDNGSIIPLDIYTPSFEGGTRMRKYLKSLDFVGDQVTNSTITVLNSDDDYQTWSNPRTVDLGNLRPRLVNCGTFRKRAYHIHHESPTWFRLQSIEMFLDLGTL